MKLKTISVEELVLETGRFVIEAAKRPVVVRSKGQPALILRALSDDDVADDLLLQSESFKAGIRAARQRRASGKKGLTLDQARRRLKVGRAT